MALDWLQTLKQFFISMSYHILVASLWWLCFKNRAIRVTLATIIWYDTLMKIVLRTGASLGWPYIMENNHYAKYYAYFWKRGYLSNQKILKLIDYVQGTMSEFMVWGTDFLWKVSPQILNSGTTLKTFTKMNFTKNLLAYSTSSQWHCISVLGNAFVITC